MVSEGERVTFLGIPSCPRLSEPTHAYMGNIIGFSGLKKKEDIKLLGGGGINVLGWVQEELQGGNDDEYDKNTVYICAKLSINKN